MKKLFSILAVAIMLFATSCAEDNVGMDNKGDVQVAFNLGVEGQSGTRAIGDGAKVDQLYYAVFEEGAATPLPAYKGKVAEDVIKFPASVKLSLAKGQRYVVVFWAQKRGTKAYTIDDNMVVTVNYVDEDGKPIASNIEERDAFYAVHPFTPGDGRTDVTLKRPFAQLNVGVTADDYNAAKQSNVVITKSKAVITSGLYNTLTLWNGANDGVVSGEVSNVTFAMAAMPTQFDAEGKANQTLDVELNGSEGIQNDEKFVYLSMNYILVGSRNISASFEFESEAGQHINFATGLDVIPVERNHRTNIIGQILTGNLNFNVTIDEGFVGDIEHEVAKPTPPADEIWYTSSDGKVITSSSAAIFGETYVFGATIVSNTYENGKGIIKFNGNVTTIGEYAFKDRTSLTSITIPNSVTSIERSAFSGCTSLESITIPESVISIGRNAFEGCTSLTSITIPNRVTSIGVYAFLNCTSLESITIPNSVKSIKDRAFRNCSSLKSIIIPQSVTSIGEYLFLGCSSLADVIIPNSVTTIGEYAFRQCYSLVDVTIPENVTSIGELAFYGCTSLKSITIPNSVTSIGDGAFEDCASLLAFYGKFSSSDNRCLIKDNVLIAFAPNGLTSYAIPQGVESIGHSTFFNCTSLKSITIPNSVTSIGAHTFNGCTSLESITIPNSVTSMEFSVFMNCTSLESVTLSNGLTSIANYTFNNCSSLTSITIPNSVTSIGSDAFYGCTSLESATLSNGLTSIVSGAFEGCTSLTSITIPQSVTFIGMRAFRNCTALKFVYCETTTVPYIDFGIFSGIPLEKIYVPTAAVKAYKDFWQDFKDIIEGYDFGE